MPTLSKPELETHFRTLQSQHEQACIDCSGLPSLVDPEDSAYRDRVYARLQRVANDLISDAEIWSLQDETTDRDTLHFCRLALEDNDPYARFECYLWSSV
jgi:hypothetical protein